MSPVATAGLAAMALAGHTLVCIGVINRLHGWGGPKWLIDLLTLATAALLPSIPLAYLLGTSGYDDRWPSVASVDAYIVAMALFAVVAIGLKLAWIEPRRYDRNVLTSWRSDAPTRLPTDRGLWIGAVANLLSYFPGNEATQIVVDRKELKLERLPAALDSLRIVHLSDLHMTGRLSVQFFEKMVDQVDALRADAIFLTGDIVENTACWPWLVEPLGRLRAPLGVYYVLGNHDAYIDASETERLLNEQGFVRLTGRWMRPTWRGEAVELGGSERPWGEAAPLPKPAQHRPFRLVLTHTPDQFAWCCRVQADLALAGHTHGGQVQLPLWGPLACPSLFGARYACGVFLRHGVVLHVTRGVSGKTPLRWRCRPEIALLTLRSQSE